MIKSVVAGKYTYLSYLFLSTACFFFWMTPNHHKLRLIRPKKGKYIIEQADIEMDWKLECLIILSKMLR